MEYVTGIEQYAGTKKYYNRSIPCDFIKSDTCSYKYFIKMNISTACSLAKIGHPKLLDILPIIPKLNIMETFRLLIETRKYASKHRVNIYHDLIEALSIRLDLLISDPNTEFIEYKKLTLNYKDLIAGGLSQAVSILPWIFPHDSEYSCSLYKSILNSKCKVKTKLKLLNLMLKNGYCPLKAVQKLIFYEKNIKYLHLWQEQLRLGNDELRYDEKSVKFVISNINLRNSEVMMLLITRAYHSLVPIIPELSKIIGNYQVMKNMKCVSYEGILKYGKSKDLVTYINEHPDSIDRKYDFLNKAIKARNKDIITQILTYFDSKELYELLVFKEGESLFDLAYYKLDQIAEIVFRILTHDQIKLLAALTHYNFNVFGLRMSIGGYSNVWEPINFVFSDILLNQHSIILYLQALYKNYTNDICSFTSAEYNEKYHKFDSESQFIDFIHISILTSPYAHQEYFIKLVLAFNLFPSIEFFKLLQKNSRVDIFELYLYPETENILIDLQLKDNVCRYNAQNQINDEIKIAYIKHLAVNNLNTLLDYDLKGETLSEIMELLLVHGYFSLYLAVLKVQPDKFTDKNIIKGSIQYISPLNRITLNFASSFICPVKTSHFANALLFFKNKSYKEFKWLHYSLLKSIEISKDCLTLINSEIISTKEINLYLKELEVIYYYFNQLALDLGLRITVDNELWELIYLTSLGIERLLALSNLITCIYEGIEIHKNHKFNEITIRANYSNDDIDIEDVILISVNYSIENNCLKLIDSDYYYKKNLDFNTVKAGLKEISSKTKTEIRLEDPVNLIQLEAINNFIINYSDLPLLFFAEIWEFNENIYPSEFVVTTPPAIVQSFSCIELPRQVDMIELNENTICPPTFSILYYKVIHQTQPDKFFNFRTEKWILYNHHEYKLLFEKETFLPYLIYKLRYKFECMCTQERNLAFNYQNYIDNIAMPIRKIFKESIFTIFDLQRPQFLHIISYAHFFADNLKGVKKLFIEFTTNDFSVKNHGEILVFYFPYKINCNSDLEKALELYLPSLDSTTEDFLVYIHTPEEIFAHTIDTRTYENLLSIGYKTYGFQFIINWDSIKAYFIPHLTVSQQYKKYINLLQLFNSELERKLSFLYFHNIFLDSIWDEAMLINGFRNAPDLIFISKLTPEKKFYLANSTVVSSKREFCIMEGNSTIYSDNLVVEDLHENKLIFVKTAAGSVFSLPSNAFPSVDTESNSLVMPEIGNILNPFPEILSISLNSNDNIRIDLSDVENSPERINDIDLIQVKSCIEYSSTLKSYFLYLLSLKQDKIYNFVLRKINYHKSLKKVIHSRDNTDKYIFKNIHTKWCPEFNINWNSFRSVEIPYKLGMDYANNILDQFYAFLEVIDRLFNSINSNSSFKIIQGNLYFRPKSSFMQKLIMKYLSRVDIIIANQKETVTVTNKVIKLNLCPAIIFEDVQSIIENNIKVISEYIIQQEIAENLFENISYISTKSERTYIEAMESIELISQTNVIIKFFRFIFRVYLRQNMQLINLNLDSSNSNLIISHVRAGRKFFKMTLGKKFYNFTDAVDLGENLLRKSNILCPFISRTILKNRFYSFLNRNSKNKVHNYSSLSESENDKINDLSLRKYDYYKGKPNTKQFYVFFSGNYPLCFRQIFSCNYLKNNNSKYDSFCMRVPGNIFTPIVKPSQYLKKNFIPLGTLFNFYIFTKSSEENFCVKTDKNEKIFFLSSSIKNITSFNEYRTLLIQFNTVVTGTYYVYEDNRLIPADFILKVSEEMDPLYSTLSYMKFYNKFVVSFYDKNSLKVFINQKDKLFTEKTLEISQHQISINIVGDCKDYSLSEIVGGSYSLEFKLMPNLFVKQFTIRVCIDNVDVQGSPYILKQEKNFILCYKKYINDHINKLNYRNTFYLKISRESFFQSMVQSLKTYPSKEYCDFKVYYINEPGSDCGGLRKDFFDCLGCYATDPNMKLFEAQGDNYRIHPEADIETLYYYGLALAIGITHKYKVPISFCDSLIKEILRLDFYFEDLKLQNPALYEGLKELGDYTLSQLESVGLNFTVKQGKRYIPLCPNGENIYVNIKNLQKYQELMTKWEFIGYAEEKILSFTKGFYSISNSMEDLFTVDEFRFIMCGLESNYIETLRKKIIAPGVLTRIKIWLLKWLENKGKDTVKKFLKFATGSSLIPIGDASWRIKLIHVSDDRLPVSHTCFNTIDIPCYENYEIFCKKMDLAIETSLVGFSLA